MRPLSIEILRTPSCIHGQAVGKRIDELARDERIEVSVTETILNDLQDAAIRRFPGSPTILIEGRDIEPQAAGATADHSLG